MTYHFHHTAHSSVLVPYGTRNPKPAVVIVDDDESLLESLTDLVRTMEYEVRAFKSAEEFLAKFDITRPGCVIVDAWLSDMSGIELLRRVSDRDLRPAIVMMSGDANVSLIVKAFKSGAADFLLKPFEFDVLSDVILRAVARDALTRRLHARRQAADARLARLTDGERDVLSQMLLGKASKAIARALGISVRGIEERRAKIMRKCDAESLCDLLHLALRSSLPELKSHVKTGQSVERTPTKQLQQLNVTIAGN